MQCVINSKQKLGDVDNAMWLLNTYVGENNMLSDVMTNIRYIVWTGKDIFKRNTANDPDKKYYSYPLQVSISIGIHLFGNPIAHRNKFIINLSIYNQKKSCEK